MSVVFRSRQEPHHQSDRRDAAGERRVLTVPNLLSLVRLLCIPIFVWLVLRPGRSGWYPAGLLLAALGATDGVDGFVARRFGQVSTVGKVLDPLADRLLLATAAVTTIAVGTVPAWVGGLVVTREVVVGAGFLTVAVLGGERMDVSWAGKAGTFGLMCALPLFLAGGGHDDWHQVAEVLAWVCTVPAMAFGWYAAAAYLPKAKAAILVGRGRGERPQ